MTKYRPGEKHHCPDCCGSGKQGTTGVIDCFLCNGKGKIE